MSRAPFQVLILPFRHAPCGYEYAVFRRADADYWQGLAGGGELGESPIEAAAREASEEAGVPTDARWMPLEARCNIPVVQVTGFLWGEDVLLLPEYAFGVELRLPDPICLSSEHTESRWCTYEEALVLLHWDSNRTALWELNHRLHRELRP